MQSRLFYKIAVIASVFLLFVGCARHQKTAEQQTPFHTEFPTYTRHLKGFKICLDPGHGGQAHVSNYKRGPTGVREAEINLKVASHLRDMLQNVGATVIMTRVDDSYVSLAKRSQIANESGADFFISLHHNGIDNSPETNYTSTWYHGDADDSRQSLDLARYIQQGVSDALRLPSSPATGLYSDKLVTASGFGVLRLTECPAVLCEASFLSNPEEETRLQDNNYLRQEAYGYLLGIARYVAAGFPKGILVAPQHTSTIQTKTPRLRIRVMDGLHERGAWMLKRQQVFTDSIRVKVDDVTLPHHYNRGTDIITVSIEKPLTSGVHFVETELVNYYGNHSLPSPQWFKVAPPAEKIDLHAWTDTLPADGKSYVGITVTALDADRMPIADNEPIYAQTSNGTLAETLDQQLGFPLKKVSESSCWSKSSKDGSAHFYLTASDTPGTATVQVSYGETHESLTIHFTNTDAAILQGHIAKVSDVNEPLQDVQLHTDTGLTANTDAQGHFFITTVPASTTPIETTLHISKVGYYPDKRQVNIAPNQAAVVRAKLHPIASGAFSSTVIILDSRTDTPDTEKLIDMLKELLELAGTKVHNIYTPGQALTTKQRIEKVNAIADEGYYLQINHVPPNRDAPVVAAHYRGNQVTETFLKRILQQFNKTLYETPITTVQDWTTPEIQQTNKMAMTLEIRSLNQQNVSPVEEAYAIFFGTWTFLSASEDIDPDEQKRFMAYLKGMQAYSSN